MNPSGPAVLLIAVIGLVWAGLYLVGLNKRWGILVPFGVMLLASSMSIALDYYGNTVATVWLPVQTKRSLIYAAAGAAAIGILMVQFRRLSGNRVPVSCAMLLLIGIYAALLRFFHNGPGDGIESTLFALATLIPLLFVVPLVGSCGEELKLVLRCIALVNAVWAGMCAVQFVVGSQQLTMGNQFRFVGLTGNPQHAGAFLAFWVVNSLWLLLNDRGRILRMFYVGLVGANLIMLVWTGSRTGLGMATIGFAAVMYTRLGRTILFMPLVVILAYFGFKAVLAITGLEVGVDRLTSTQDTRSNAWLTLYQIGAENPLFGAGTDDAERSENSWLYAFAAYGIGMVALTVLLAFIAMTEILKGLRMRSWLILEDRRLLDLALGVIAMYFAGALLEGYIISRISAATCFFIVFAGIAGAMTRQAALNRAWASADPEDEFAWEDGHEEPEVSELAY